MTSDWERVRSLGLLPGNRSESDYKKNVAEGLRTAREFLSALPSSIPTLKDIQMAHALAFSRVHSWAGTFRPPGYEVDVGGMQCTKAEHIPQQLHALTREVKDVLQLADSPVKQVLWYAQYHSAFEMIHPFQDGNGRIGRLILGVQLDRALKDNRRCLFDRAEYLSALEMAQLGGNISPLVEVIVKGRSLIHRLERRSGVSRLTEIEL